MDDIKSTSLFNRIDLFVLPSLTIGTQIAIALKFPERGLIINLAAEPFWLYSTRKAYKKAGQIGMLISTIIFTVETAVVINYSLL